MRIDIATLFTQMCGSVLNESIVGRGIRNGFIEVHTHDIRKYTENKHRRVDDKPYGGGTGMLMQAQPVYDCISAIKSQGEGRPRIIYMSPQGEVLTQQKVQELAQEPWLILLCGHYEGIDQRVLDELEVEELSVGELVIFLEQRIYFFAVLRKSFLVLLVSDYLGNSVEELKVGF